jgi:hypothetical protein
MGIEDNRRTFLLADRSSECSDGGAVFVNGDPAPCFDVFDRIFGAVIAIFN